MSIELLSAHLRDVRTGRERLVVAGDHHRADGVVGVEARERVAQLVDQRAVERIQYLRPVEHDQTDCVCGFRTDAGVVHHSVLMCMLLPAKIGRPAPWRSRGRCRAPWWRPRLPSGRIVACPAHGFRQVLYNVPARSSLPPGAGLNPGQSEMVPGRRGRISRKRAIMERIGNGRRPVPCQVDTPRFTRGPCRIRSRSGPRRRRPFTGRSAGSGAGRLESAELPLVHGRELNTCYNALDLHVESGRGDQPALIHDSPVTGTKRRYP